MSESERTLIDLLGAAVFWDLVLWLAFLLPVLVIIFVVLVMFRKL